MCSRIYGTCISGTDFDAIEGECNSEDDVCELCESTCTDSGVERASLNIEECDRNYYIAYALSQMAFVHELCFEQLKIDACGLCNYLGHTSFVAGMTLAVGMYHQCQNARHFRGCWNTNDQTECETCSSD